jgi:hypothetical protein
MAKATSASSSFAALFSMMISPDYAQGMRFM